jgi:dTDP-4-amino-4,6-dideoxygalactose transaminase
VDQERSMSSQEPSNEYLPYSRPFITEDDITAVTTVLRGSTISQGDVLDEFEAAFARRVGARDAVAFSSGTAALHGMCDAAGLGQGAEVIVPAMTFAGTPNAVRLAGATPVFCDIDPKSYCISPASVRDALSGRTRAILTVDFAGHPSEYDELKAIAEANDLDLLSDGAHAPGASYRGRPVGSSLAKMTAFSLNPVKNITAGEGGLVTTDDPDLASHLRQFRTHGMTRDPERLLDEAPGDWYYEQQMLGPNYKLSELHAALGLSQLGRLTEHNARRTELADYYDRRLAALPVQLPSTRPHVIHAWHLYVVLIGEEASVDRDTLFAAMRSRGLGVQVHYIPVPLHPDYRRLGYRLDHSSVAMRYFRTAISLPLHPAMSTADADRVVHALSELL